jgi:hypothetical protein
MYQVKEVADTRLEDDDLMFRLKSHTHNLEEAVEV